ncbi:MAG: SBBP repeat-containing protein [Bacteroidota bacterium]
MIRKILFTLLLVLPLGLFAQKTNWILSFGGTDDDQAYDCVQASDGNLLVCGVVSDTADFGAVHLETAGRDLFVMKLDTAGNVLWVSTATSLGGASVTGYGIATDTDGNVYVGGRYVDTTYFGTTTLYPNSDEKGEAFVAKLNSGGDFLWAKGFAGPGGDQVEKLAVSGTDVIVTIRASNIITIGGTEVKNDYPDASTTYSLAVVVSLDASGEVNWIDKVNAKSSFVRDVKTSSGGAVYTVFEATMVAATPYISTVGVAGLTPMGNPLGNSDVFLAEIDPSDGSVEWINRIGSTGTDMSYALALDKDNNIFVGLLVQGETQLNSQDGNYIKVPLHGAKFDYLLCKYSKEGNVLWGDMEGGSDNEGIYDLAVAEKGEIYTMAYFLDPATTFGDDEFTIDRDGNGSLLVRHDNDGSYLWGLKAESSYADGVSSNIYGWAMSMGSDFQLLMCGSFIGSVTFFTGETFDDGMQNKDVWIALLEPGDIDTTTVIIEGLNPVDDERAFFYPNPASDVLTFSGTELSRVVIRDMAGRVVVDAAPEGKQLGVGNLPVGMYLLSGFNSEGILYKKKLLISR